jgi:small subunit ribosomal protein S18
MARNNVRDRSTRRAPKETGRKTKKKVCIFCKDRIDYVDYKEVNLLRKFMSDRGKIRARRVSGNCAQHQRAVAVAIKTARELVLLPYTQRTTSERPGGRGMGRGRGGDFPRPAVAAAEVEAETEESAESFDAAGVEEELAAVAASGDGGED